MAQTECDEVTVRFELAQFRDWAKSSGKRSEDWQAELRKFVRGRRPKVVPFQGQACVVSSLQHLRRDCGQKAARVAAEWRRGRSGSRSSSRGVTRTNGGARRGHRNRR